MSDKIEIKYSNLPSYEFYFGCLYILFSSKKDIQKEWLNQYCLENNNISFVNSPFKGAIKVPPYIRRFRKELNVDSLQKRNNISGLIIDKFEFFHDVMIVVLRELLQKDIIVVELTGLANSSIIKLIQYCYLLLEANRRKIIILVQNDLVGIKYPKFYIDLIDDDKIKELENWYNGVGDRG